MTNKTQIKKDDVAISVSRVSKTFRIPHEKVTSIRGAVVGGLSSIHLPFLGGGQGGGSSYEEFKVYPVANATGALDVYPVVYTTGDVNFEVKKGEFFACPPMPGYGPLRYSFSEAIRRGIIGRNGSSKSIRMQVCLAFSV